MHDLVEHSTLIGAALNFAASVIRLATVVMTRRRPSPDHAKTEIPSEPGG
jgi:hypothetical protein